MDKRTYAILVLIVSVAFNGFATAQSLSHPKFENHQAISSKMQKLSTGTTKTASLSEANKSRYITVANTLPVVRLNEPASVNLTFSQGEAYNNSLRMHDPDGNEVPYQVKDALYYPGSKYYSQCSLLFPVNITGNSEVNYTITYTSQNIGTPDFREWSDLNISGDGTHQNITIWNSFFKAVIPANSSQGISQFYYFPISENRSLVWGGWSLVGFSFSVNGTLYGAGDLADPFVRILYKGPLFIEVAINGNRGDLYVEYHVLFFARFPSLYAKIILENRGTKLDWYYPLHVLYNRGFFSRYLLSDGTDGTITSTGWGKSFPPQKWWALYDPASGGICNIQTPYDGIAHLVIGGNFTDFDVAFNKGKGIFLDNKGARMQFLTKIFLSVMMENETLTYEYEKFIRPLIISPQAIVAVIRILSPREVEIDTKFEITAEIVALMNCTNSSVSLSFPKGVFTIEHNQTTRYVGSLTFGQIKLASWNLTANQEGEYTLTVTLKCQEGKAVGETSAIVSLPTPVPLAPVTIRTMDINGEQELGNLNITLLDIKGEVYRSILSNKTGYASLKVNVGNYQIKVYSDSRQVGYVAVSISAPTFITINCWAYDVNILLLNRDEKPLLGMAVGLKPVVDKIKGETGIVFAGQSTATGIARIENVWSGTYSATVFGGGAKVANATVDVSEDEQNLTLICDLADLTVRVINPDGQPIFNATGLLYSEASVISREFSDINGYLRFRNLLLGHYTVAINWMGVSTGFADIALIDRSKELTIESSVSRLIIACVNIWDKPLAGANVVIQTGREILRRTADDFGYVSEFVPKGRSYTISVSSGIYSGSMEVTVTESSIFTVVCNVQSTIFVYLIVVGIAWVSVGWFYKKQRREVSFELLRLKERILQLDELYGRGEVEYSLYKKLKNEYEEELRKFREQGAE